MVSLRGIWPDGRVPDALAQELPDIAFVRVLREAGLQVEAVIVDGKIHRVSGEDERHKKSGWYVYYQDGVPSGAYGDWRSGMVSSWCSKASDSLSNAERIAYEAQLEKAKRERLEEEERLYEETALKAEAYVAACKSAPDSHPYLQRKRVRAYPGVLVDGTSNLVLPMRDIAGKLWTYETISITGRKLFCKHGRKGGSFFVIGELGDTIRLVEGYATGATVHEATGDGVVVTMDSGNLIAVAPTIRSRYPQARIVVCSDNDAKEDGSNPGVEAARKAASLSGADVLVPQFAKQGTGTDYNDLAAAEGIDTARAQLVVARTARILNLQHITAFTQPRPMAWAVRGLLPAVGVAQIFGDSQTGKSFLAIDLTLRIASGMDWHGLRTRTGPVIYIAGEGGAGIGKRAAAWAQTHTVDLATVPFHLCQVGVPLADPKAARLAYEDMRDFLSMHGAPSVVVVDTLARNFGEDENSSQAIGAFVSALDSIKEMSQCLILVIHHTGHNSKERSRGSYAWHAALDAEYRLKRDESGLVSMECTKAKDWDPIPPIYFSMDPVDLQGWVDEDGQTASSLVLSRVYPQESAEELKKSLDTVRTKGRQQQALQVLAELQQTHRDRLEEDGRDPLGARVSVDEWRYELVLRGVIGSDRRRFHDLRSRLEERGLRVENGYVQPVDNLVDK